MCRAADLASIGQHGNKFDKFEFDIEEIAKELSMYVDPDTLRSISIKQCYIDQCMIVHVTSCTRLVCLRMRNQLILDTQILIAVLVSTIPVSIIIIVTIIRIFDIISIIDIIIIIIVVIIRIIIIITLFIIVIVSNDNNISMNAIRNNSNTIIYIIIIIIIIIVVVVIIIIIVIIL
jgi:hypothetical protein